jgi:hypothetical protein
MKAMSTIKPFSWSPLMPNPISALRRFLAHQGGVTLFAVGLLLLSTFVRAQTPVVLAPVPQLQFFDQTGTPLAFGCVFTYQVGTTTGLATYTDYTGVTQNKQPVILSAGGSANIWLLAGQAYTFRVKSAGGSNCSSGSTLYTVNGIGGGSTTLTTVVPYSSTPSFQVQAQNQLFQITLSGNASAQPLTFVGITPPSYVIFQITQDSSGGHTWSWPANSLGGCTIGSAANQVTTQEFIYNGVTATAIGPCVTGAGPIISAGNIYDFGLTASTGVCTDANNQLVSGSGCATIFGVTVNGQGISPGGSGNVNAGAAAHSIALNEGNGDAIAGLLLGANAVPIGQASADPVGSTLPNCPDSSGNHLNYATSGHSFTCGTSATVGVVSTGINASPCTTGGTSYASCSTTVTITPTQADTNYAAVCSGVGNSPLGEPFIQNLIKSTTNIQVITVNGTSAGATASAFNEIDCTAIHP